MHFSAVFLLHLFRLFHGLASVVIPLRCAACDAVLEWQEGEWCGPCAFSLRRNLTQAQHRFAGRLDNVRCWSWWVPGEEGGERQAVHRLKYGGRANLGRALGKAMAEEAPIERWSTPEKWAVVPIPLHRRRQRQRGYNQSGLLTEGWCSVTGMVPMQLLVRTRHRSSLTRLGRRDRLQSLANTYRFDANLTWSPEDWDGIILMDDVVTTGATLEAAWTALRKAWNGPIDFVTLLDAAP